MIFFKKQEGNYIEDKWHGKWIFWNDNGEKKSSRYYQEGELIVSSLLSFT